MGGCVGTTRNRRPSSLSGNSSSSLRGGGNSSSSTKNRPLRREKIRWKSDIPLTNGQLKSKREEFWDTAPAFEGKPEIWNALRAAAEAAESSEDFELAQAILDGAGISIPNGSLVECYDELGTRYAIPVYCLSLPVNLLPEDSDFRPDSPSDFSETLSNNNNNNGSEIRLKVRISSLKPPSSNSNDVKLLVNSESSVGSCKKKLQIQEGLKHSPSRQRWYYGGKLLSDKSKIGKFGIPNGYVVQCVLNNLDFDIIETKD